MSKTIEHFDILLSCPSDITEEKTIIEKEITEFNRLYGIGNKIALNLVHWSTDVFAESGGSPQSLINKQIVHECDAAIAVFWTKFGTPTENHDSGTEEEIEELLNKGIQVFLYFSDKSIPPSKMDKNIEQYEKVIQFKERYKKKGIYNCYSDNEEFQNIIRRDIALYFLKKIDDSSTSKQKSQLLIRSVENDKISDLLIFRNTSFSQLKFLKELEQTIFNLFHQVDNINIPKEETEAAFHFGSQVPSQFLNELKYSKQEQVVFNESIQCRIISYASKMGVLYGNDFFNVGTLKRSISIMSAITRTHSYDYYGTDDEKEKSKLIYKLNKLILNYNQYIEYFEKIDSLNHVKLALFNNGTAFDEDIDIKIICENGIFCNTSSLPIPGDLIIEEINEHVKDIYVSSKSADIDEYPDYPSGHNKIPFPIIPSFNRKSDVDEQKEFQEKHVELLNQIMPYECFSTSENDIIKFKVNYMKHNTAMYFPSLLLFHQEPASLKYEIRSKNHPDVITDTLKK